MRRTDGGANATTAEEILAAYQPCAPSFPPCAILAHLSPSFQESDDCSRSGREAGGRLFQAADRAQGQDGGGRACAAFPSLLVEQI